MYQTCDQELLFDYPVDAPVIGELQGSLACIVDESSVMVMVKVVFQNAHHVGDVS